MFFEKKNRLHKIGTDSPILLDYIKSILVHYLVDNIFKNKPNNLTNLI
jgi:hypothetical protein